MRILLLPFIPSAINYANGVANLIPSNVDILIISQFSPCRNLVDETRMMNCIKNLAEKMQCTVVTGYATSKQLLDKSMAYNTEGIQLYDYPSLEVSPSFKPGRTFSFKDREGKNITAVVGFLRDTIHWLFEQRFLECEAKLVILHYGWTSPPTKEKEAQYLKAVDAWEKYNITIVSIGGSQATSVVRVFHGEADRYDLGTGASILL